MATIELRTYPAKPSGSGFAIVFSLSGHDPDPFPPRTVECKRVADLDAALIRYIAEAEATGLPGAVCVQTIGRAFPGFKAWQATQPHAFRINV